MTASRTLPIACLILILLAPHSAPAQHPPVVLPRTEQRTLQSSLNDVAYKLYVSLPTGYDKTAVRYPVIYLLDAEYSFAIAHNIVEH